MSTTQQALDKTYYVIIIQFWYHSMRFLCGTGLLFR